MTQDKDLKRLVRARMIETGQSYTTALKAVRDPSMGVPAHEPSDPRRDRQMKYTVLLRDGTEAGQPGREVTVEADGYHPPGPAFPRYTFYRVDGGDERNVATFPERLVIYVVDGTAEVRLISDGQQ